jgi:hypothetical protein
MTIVRHPEILGASGLFSSISTLLEQLRQARQAKGMQEQVDRRMGQALKMTGVDQADVRPASSRLIPEVGGLGFVSERRIDVGLPVPSVNVVGQTNGLAEICRRNSWPKPMGS